MSNQIREENNEWVQIVLVGNFLCDQVSAQKLRMGVLYLKGARPCEPL